MAIHKFTKLIERGEPIKIYGDGTAKRDFTYISDIISGVIEAIKRCNGFNIYNLGESKVIQLMELVKIIEKNLNKQAEIIKYPPQPGDMLITYADISKAQKELDYKPLVDIKQGISRFIQWYREDNSN